MQRRPIVDSWLEHAVAAKLSDKFGPPRVLTSDLRRPMAVTSDGSTVWSADALSHRVQSMTPTGRVTRVVDIYDEPSGLVHRSDGNLLIAAAWERRIYLFRDAVLEVMVDLRKPIAGRLNHIALAPGGILYVATSRGNEFDFEGPGSIVGVGPEGEVIAVTETASGVFGLAIRSGGRHLVVSEPGSDRINEFDIRSDGSLDLLASRELPGVKPLGLAAAGVEDLWVCSAAQQSCLLLTPEAVRQTIKVDGRATACATTDSGQLIVASQDQVAEAPLDEELSAGRIFSFDVSSAVGHPTQRTQPRTAQPEVLVSGLWFAENPRWHAGKLWFADITAHRVMTADLFGATEVVAQFYDEPSGLGFLPDGTPLVVTMWKRRIYRIEAGRGILHADVGSFPGQRLNDMVVDGRGRAYVNNTYPRRLSAPQWWAPNPNDRPGHSDSLAVIDPDGTVHIALEGKVKGPNGMIVTPDGATLILSESGIGRLTKFSIEDDGTLTHPEVYADMPEPNHPDGICLDAEGAIWAGTGASPTGDFVRILPGGRITHKFSVPGRWAVACMLGGPERRTLFMLSVETTHETLRQQGGSNSRIDVAAVDVPGVGWP